MYNNLSKKKKEVSKGQRELTFWENLYLPTILNGMRITFSHFFKKKVSLNYPEVTKPYSDIYRGQHVLKRDEQGRENCTACGLCAVSCPAEAITMVAAERKKGEEHLYREEKYAAKYEINMLRCIFCGLCEEACPKDAIYLTPRKVASEYERETFIYGKDILVEPVDARIDISKRKKPKLDINSEIHYSA